MFPSSISSFISCHISYKQVNAVTSHAVLMLLQFLCFFVMIPSLVKCSLTVADAANDTVCIDMYYQVIKLLQLKQNASNSTEN